MAWLIYAWDEPSSSYIEVLGGEPDYYFPNGEAFGLRAFGPPSPPGLVRDGSYGFMIQSNPEEFPTGCTFIGVQGGVHHFFVPSAAGSGTGTGGGNGGEGTVPRIPEYLPADESGELARTPEEMREPVAEARRRVAAKRAQQRYERDEPDPTAA
jgi:hypothetical protein